MGKIICLSGLDGSGKSTQVELVKKYLEENNIKYAHVHFPIYGDNEASKVVAAYLRGEFGDINEVDPIFVANIYAMDRYLYLPKLQKLLKDNDVVLLDRYTFCNMAFQGAKYNTDVQAAIIREWIAEYEFGFLELPYPDLTLFFDVPIDIIEARLKEERPRDYLDGKQDIHEKNIEFQANVRRNYLAMKDDFIHYEVINTCVAPQDEGDGIRILTPKQLFEKYKFHLDSILINYIKI